MSRAMIIPFAVKVNIAQERCIVMRLYLSIEQIVATAQSGSVARGESRLQTEFLHLRGDNGNLGWRI